MIQLEIKCPWVDSRFLGATVKIFVPRAGEEAAGARSILADGDRKSALVPGVAGVYGLHRREDFGPLAAVAVSECDSIRRGIR